MDRLRRSILSGRAMIAFQVSRRRRSTYQRNKADPSRLRRFGGASLGRRGLIARPVGFYKLNFKKGEI